MRYLLPLALLFVLAACSSASSDTEEELHDAISSAARRIAAPMQEDTLRVSIPFTFQAFVECHDPIVGLRIEFTDNSGSLGEGGVVGSIVIPATGTTEVTVDTVLTLPTFARKTADNVYGFILVEEYETADFRAGFTPVVVLD